MQILLAAVSACTQNTSTVFLQCSSYTVVRSVLSKSMQCMKPCYRTVRVIVIVSNDNQHIPRYMNNKTQERKLCSGYDNVAISVCPVCTGIIFHRQKFQQKGPFTPGEFCSKFFACEIHNQNGLIIFFFFSRSEFSPFDVHRLIRTHVIVNQQEFCLSERAFRRCIT